MQTLAEGRVDLESMTGDELSARLRDLDRERSRVELELAETLAAWDARQQWAADGAVAPSTWLAWQCDMSRGSARGMVRTARRLRSMPLTVGAARAGALGAQKVALLARAAAHSDAAADAFARHESLLVEHAEKLSVDQLAVLLREWLMRVDAEAGPDDDEKQHERRRLHLSRTLNGTWAINGTLSDDAGSWLSAALERECAEMKANEKATGAEPSTPAQRRADALLALCKGSAEASLPDVTIVVNAEDLGSGFRSVVQRLTCDAVLRRVVMNGAGHPLDLGRSERLISPAQRKALALRDRGCVFPGCDRPPDRCLGHHIVHWVNGGPTDMHNLCLLCEAHHHAVHKRGFGLARGPDGRIIVTRPDGQVLTRR